MVFLSPSWVPDFSVDAIPDSIPVSQFILDEQHGRCKYSRSKAPFVCVSGRQYSASCLRDRIECLTRAIAKELCWDPNEGSEWDKVVTIYALNTIDTLSVSWAVHNLSGISSPANAAYTLPEICHQIKESRSGAVFTCLPLLNTTLEAANKCGIPREHVYILSMPDDSNLECQATRLHPFKSVDTLIKIGASLPLIEPLKWQKGQAAKQCAFLMFSSGTTGLPKGVMVSHRNVIANIMQICTFEAPTRKPTSQNVNLGLLPQSHIYGLVAICHASVYRGESVVVLAKFGLRSLCEAIERYRINVLYVVPPILLSMTSSSQLLDKFDLSCVTEVFSGAAPLSPQVAFTLQLLYPAWKIRQAYGLTETATVVSSTSPDDILLGSCGCLLPGVEARLLSHDDGSEIHAYNNPGELYLRSPSVTNLGYLKNPDATKETFGATGNRWLRTGDEAMIVLNKRPHGQQTEHLMIVDRIKELIKVKGHQVAPAELEACLLTHPLVADAAVISVPDLEYGELPKAFVVLQGGGEANAAESAGKSRDIINDVDGFVRKQKARYKWLTGGIEIIDAIPKNPSGKILRRVLKARDTERHKSSSNL